MSVEPSNIEEPGEAPAGSNYPDILDKVSAPVVVVDRLGLMTKTNEVFARAVGCSTDELKGRYLWEFLGGERLADLKRHLADTECLDPDSPWTLLLQDSHGGCQLLEWSFQFVDEGHEEPQHVVCTGINGTGTPRSRSLFDDEPLIQPLIEYSSDVLCVLAPDGSIRYASPSVERVFGYRPDSLVGTNAFDLLNADDLADVDATINQGIGSPGTPEMVHVRVRHRDGTWLDTEARGVAHQDGDTIHLLVNLTDISQRKRAEVALAESEERFRSAFENTAIGKVLWDPVGRLVRANRAVQNMLALSDEEILGIEWRKYCHPEDLKGFEPDLNLLMNGDVPSAQSLLRLRHRDGPWIWARVTLAVVHDTDGAPCHVIGEIEDITEQRNAEEDKRARTSRLDRQQSAIVSIATDHAVVNGDLEEAFTTITELATSATEVARASIWLFNDERSILTCSNLFDAATQSHRSDLEMLADAFPAFFEALESDRVVEADDARSDPRTAELAETYLTPLGITSMLNAPIRVRGRAVGVISLEHTGDPRIWQSDELAFAGEVADQIAQALTSAQRNMAESRLQMSEERFRSVVNSIPMGLHMYRLTDDDELVFSGANPAADDILGVDCQEFMGKTIEEAFPSLADTEIPNRYRQAAMDGTAWHTEQIHYEDERIQVAYEVHAFQTAPRVVTVVFLDITDSKRSDDALRASEARYRTLFERNLAGVFRSTVKGTIVECNDAFARILGRSKPDEVMSHDAADFYQNPADRERLIETINRSGELRNREMMLRRLDGTSVCVLANMSLTRDADGMPEILEGTMFDISERKQAEDRLLLQSTALAAAANAIAITDSDGTIQWTNPSFTALTGYPSSEAIGQSLWQLKAGNGQGNPSDEIVAAVEDGMAWQGELVNQRKDGRLYTEEMTVTPVRSDDGEINHLIAVQQDVSQRKHIEEQLLQAQKMEAVGRLAGGVAHDFNNLLQAMLGATELLRKHASDDEDAASRLSEIEEHVRRGSQLTRQLLLFSRRDTERQEQLDLNDVAHGTIKLLHRLLRENIELVFAPADIDLPLVADRGQIEQVVMNLAVNACDAMPGGGRLFLRTGRDAESAWLEVADSGEGIPDEIRDQLFEPFFTTKDPGKGTGLGLSVVHEIVTRLGGTIDVESRVGNGTCIRITFPSIKTPTEDLPVSVPNHKTSAGNGQRILVVEDDPAVRSGLREILGVLGYNVTTVGSRQETVYLPPAPEFDLLLTDYVLPDGSGTEIARDLSDRWPAMQVIVMSGYAQDVPIGPDSKIEGMEFLQKPFGTDKLADTVRSVLAKGAEPDQQVLDESA